jgi:hypothetical protein
MSTHSAITFENNGVYFHKGTQKAMIPFLEEVDYEILNHGLAPEQSLSVLVSGNSAGSFIGTETGVRYAYFFKNDFYSQSWDLELIPSELKELLDHVEKFQIEMKKAAANVHQWCGTCR